MLSFDKLQKTWNRTIATNDAEFKKCSESTDNVSDEVNEFNSKNDIQWKLNYIEKSIELLNRTHPVTMEDKAIYDLANTERAEIHNQVLKASKIISDENISPKMQELLNTVFELGGNVKAYNMALGYQKYFEAAQKKQTNITNQAKKKEIDRKAYFAIVQMVYDTIMKHTEFSLFSGSIVIEQIDFFLQSKVKTKSKIVNTVKVFSDKGVISINRGTKTTYEKEQAKALASYLSNTYQTSFFDSVNDLYQSIAQTNISLAFDQQLLKPAQDEIKIVNTCNALLNNPIFEKKLLNLPIKCISDGIVKKFAENSFSNSKREAYLKNKIELEIRVKYIDFYNGTINKIPSPNDKNTFLEVYRLAQKDGVI